MQLKATSGWSSKPEGGWFAISMGMPSVKPKIQPNRLTELAMRMRPTGRSRRATVTPCSIRRIAPATPADLWIPCGTSRPRPTLRIASALST